MSTRGGAALADLLRAVHGLAADDEATIAAIAGMLGLGASLAASAAPPAVREPEPSGPADRAGGRTLLAEADAAEPTAATRPLRADAEEALRPWTISEAADDAPAELATAATRMPELGERTLPSSLKLVRTQPPVEPAAVGDGAVGGGAAAHLATGAGGIDHVAPWPARWAPGIAYAASAKVDSTNRLDVAYTVRAAAAGQLIRRYPRLRRLTLRRGVQLLLDHSDVMRPFALDRLWLTGLMLSVVGRDQVEALRFRGTPLRGVVGGVPGFRPYALPRPGVPLVIFSDLGLLRMPFGPPADPGAWPSFLLQTAAAHQITVISPYPIDAYPPAIRRRALIVALDDRTNIRAVMRSDRRFDRRRRS